MNYWCDTCNCYKDRKSAAECAVDNHSLLTADGPSQAHSARLEIIQKLGYGASSIASAEWIVAKVQAERDASKAQIATLKKVIHEVHGILDAVLHAADPIKSMKAWIPIAMRDCRKAMGLPVEELPPLSAEDRQLLEKIGFKLVTEPVPKQKEDWIPKVGDRVWVSGKTWSCPGTITGWAKDDPSVPWIKVDKDGSFWDARDLGSVRKAQEEDRWDPV